MRAGLFPRYCKVVRPVFVTVTNFLPLLLDAREILGTFRSGAELTCKVSRHFAIWSVGIWPRPNKSRNGYNECQCRAKSQLVKVRLFIGFAGRPHRSLLSGKVATSTPNVAHVEVHAHSKT
jgi:hypothetical protein